VCASRCVPDLVGCADGEACRATTEPDRYACVAAPGAGCGCAGAPDAGTNAGGLALVIMLMWGRRSRRRRHHVARFSLSA
ncbi:MAG: hypothetical protein KC464_14235, partial [Myxococcales bacterium]|nr:hypothetical protein [Myxococcales bacterium]